MRAVGWWILLGTLLGGCAADGAAGGTDDGTTDGTADGDAPPQDGRDDDAPPPRDDALDADPDPGTDAPGDGPGPDGGDADAAPTDADGALDGIDAGDAPEPDARPEDDGGDPTDGDDDTAPDGGPLCEGVERWTGIYGGTPYCPDYAVDADFDATHCEFFLDGFGHGTEGHYGIPFEWLEAYLRVNSFDGEALGAGMLVRYVDPAAGTMHLRWSYGVESSPGVVKTGFTYLFTDPLGPGSYRWDLVDFAFFLDVRRSTGEVVRLWHSRGGRNYSWADAFTLPTTVVPIPYGRVEYAHEAGVLFDPRRTCL